MNTPADVTAAIERVFGPPRPRTPVHPMQEQADERRIERAERDAWFDGYATEREMDGAAADWWARLGGEL